jgi:AraC-like DNA-binding protein
MRTRDLDQAVAAVTSVYCPHAVQIAAPRHGIDVVLEVDRRTSQPLVELSYAAPVEIDAGAFPRLFLMMHCAQGSAAATQDNRHAEWRKGRTLPLSAGRDTRLRFDAAFVQKGLRLDVDKLEMLCARWVGHPLDEPLQFALQPFSEDFERIWQRTMAYLWAQEEGGLFLAGAARAAFDEFLLTLLLQHHPHNYSEEIAREPRTPVPGVVRRAERFMANNATAPITVSDIAAHLDVSIRSLQMAFRQWRGTTPNAVLRGVRLRCAREDLQSGAASVTDVALRYGFANLGRFSGHYRSAFGESPSTTRRRGRARARQRRRYAEAASVD